MGHALALDKQTSLENFKRLLEREFRDRRQDGISNHKIGNLFRKSWTWIKVFCDAFDEKYHWSIEYELSESVLELKVLLSINSLAIVEFLTLGSKTRGQIGSKWWISESPLRIFVSYFAQKSPHPQLFANRARVHEGWGYGYEVTSGHFRSKLESR